MRRLRLLFALIVAAVLVVPLPVAAQLSPEQKKIFRNHVLYFNYEVANPNGACGAGAQTPAAPGNINPSVEADNVRIGYEYFVQKGLAPFRSAGIIGNLQVEAPGLDPQINQGNAGAGRGIAQWSVNGRWVDLQAFAREQGRSDRDLLLQLDFIWHEMNNVPPWNQALPGIQAATDISAATRSFMELYEKPGIPHFDRRLAAAQAVLSLYGNGAPSSGPAAEGGTASPTPGAGSPVNCPPVGGNFTNAPGQTQPKGQGFTLINNTDYSATPCAVGSTEVQVYRHPVNGYQIRLCVIDGTSIDIASIVSDRAIAMIAAANAAGVRLNGGGFRTYEEQLATRRANGCSVPAGPSSAGCSPPTAAPGNSQHERGLAIDFASGGTIRRGSPQFNWLAANAAQFGFYNLPVEPWHWSTSGN